MKPLVKNFLKETRMRQSKVRKQSRKALNKKNRKLKREKSRERRKNNK